MKAFFCINYLLLFFLLNLNSLLFAKAMSKNKRIKLLQLDHKNIGCPENSICSSELGKLRLKWLDILSGSDKLSNRNFFSKVKRFFLKNGIPIMFWARDLSYDKSKTIIWDSNCSHHLKNKISVGMSFLNNGKGKELLDQIILENKKGELKKYLVPIGMIPTHIVGDRLVFLFGDNGYYFDLLISPYGKWNIKQHRKRKEVIGDDVECSSSLKKYKLDNKYDGIYLSSYCKKIYSDNMDFYLIKIYWSCFL